MLNYNLQTNEYDSIINEVEKLLELNLFRDWLIKKDKKQNLSSDEECLLSSYLNEHLNNKGFKYKVILSDGSYIVDCYIESNLPYWAEIFSESNGYLGFATYDTYQKLIDLINVDYFNGSIDDVAGYIKKIDFKYYKELVKTGVIKEIKAEYYEYT